MKALVLAAGYGTRLYPIIKDTPKALLDINGRPLLNYIIEKLMTLNTLNEIIVVTNNKFYRIFEKWALDLRSVSVFPDIKIVNDGTNTPEDRLGSIGDIDFVLNNMTINDDLLVVGGDNLFNFNVQEYILFAVDKSPAVTIGVYDIGNIKEAKKFGVVLVNGNNKILSFEEKPSSPASSLIAMCFYYFPRSSLGMVSEYLRESKKSDKAGDYIKWLIGKTDVYGFKFSGTWYDIGSIEAYREAQMNFK